MKWLDALKQWNAGTGAPWTIPKKGTKEHDQVLAIQGRTGAEEPEDEEAKRIVDEAIAMGAEEPQAKKPKKARKAKKPEEDQGGYSAE